MDQLSPLIPIEQYAFTKTFSLYILSYYLHLYFLRYPLRSFNFSNLIRSTHRTGHLYFYVTHDQTIVGDFLSSSFYRGYAYFSTNILISHLISPRVTTHPMKRAHLCYTHLLGVISLYSPTFCAI